MRIKGELFLCDEHGLDYRICCDECQEKYLLFHVVASQAIASKGQGHGEETRGASSPQKLG